MKRYWAFLAVLAVIAIAFLLWRATQMPDDPTLAGRNELIVQLQWEPSVQFIGFYAAKRLHYYAQEGITVEFLHAGPNIDPIKNVTNSTAGVGLATADQVLVWNDRSVDQDKKLKALGTVFNRSLACFMSKTASPITRPEDFRGKNVGVYPLFDTDSILRILLKRNQIPVDAVTIIDFPQLVNFEQGTVDAFPSYFINEPVWAELNDIEVEVLDPREFGVDFYSDTIITTVPFYNANRDLLERFVRASAKGWNYAENNHAEALALMYDEVRAGIGLGKPRAKQEKALPKVLQYLRDGPNKHMFFMVRSQWEKMESALAEINRISRLGLVDELCDFNFVDKAMKK